MIFEKIDTCLYRYNGTEITNLREQIHEAVENIFVKNEDHYHKPPTAIIVHIEEDFKRKLNKEFEKYARYQSPHSFIKYEHNFGVVYFVVIKPHDGLHND